MAKLSKAKKPPIKIENKATIFEKIYFSFFLFLPIIYSESIVDPVLIPRQLYLTLFLCIVVFVIKRKIDDKKLVADFSFIRLPVFIALFVFLFTVILSFVQSLVLSESLYITSKYSIEILFLIITTYLVIQKQLSRKNIVKSVIAFGTIVLIIALYQSLQIYLSESKFSENIYNIKSTIGHKNLLASLLFLLFPFILNNFFGKKQLKVPTLILGISILLIIWILQTRAVFIAVFIFTALFIFLIIKYQNRAESPYSIKKIFLSLSILLIVFSSITFQNKAQFSRIFNKDSAFERFSMWENSITMIKENILFGVGAGNWQVHFPENGLDKFPDLKVKQGLLTFQRPHNDFLWVFSELGIVGILAYISIFVLILYYTIRLLKIKNKKECTWFYASIISCVIGYLGISMFDFPLERIEHQIILFLLFAIIIADYQARFKNIALSNTNSYLLFILFLSTSIFSTIVCTSRYKGEKHTHKLYQAHKSSNWIEMINEADNSINSYYKLDATSVPINWYKGVAQFSLGNFNDALESFKSAYQLHPYNIHVLNNLASCYEKLGQHNMAIFFYKKVLLISTNFEETKLNLSAVYYNIGKFEQAFQVINRCSVHSIDPKYKKFLPAILHSKVEIILKKQKKSEIIKKLRILLVDPEKIVWFFWQSKKKNCTFEYYVMQTLK